MTPPQTALPRRPLTVGELLDAAAQLVRYHAKVLFPIAALLALAEQAMLTPMRTALDADLVMSGFHPTSGHLLVMVIGFGTEAAAILMLGPWAGRAMALDLVGGRATTTAVARPRVGDLGVLLAAPLAAALTILMSLAGPLWMLGYGLFGLAGVVIGMERRGPIAAVGRAVTMAFRSELRAIWVRSLGYFAWLMLRLGLFIGLLTLLDYLPLTHDGMRWALAGGLAVANTIAYVFLAALDAATLAEGRFRSEALDIWLSRAQRHGPLTPRHVAVKA